MIRINIKEKKEVLKLLGVKILDSGMPVYTSDEVNFVGCLQGFFIYSYSYYWIINGRMPLKYAEELYEYKDLEIRVSGGNKDNKPIDCCTNDEFEKAKEEASKKYQLGITSLDQLSKQYTIDKEKYIYNNLDNCYIETIEGLKKVIDVIKENNIKTEWN